MFCVSVLRIRCETEPIRQMSLSSIHQTLRRRAGKLVKNHSLPALFNMIHAPIRRREHFRVFLFRDVPVASAADGIAVPIGRLPLVAVFVFLRKQVCHNRGDDSTMGHDDGVPAFV